MHRSHDLEEKDTAEDGSALTDAASNRTSVYFSKREESCLLRRIDLRILTLLCPLWFLQFLDKSTLNYAGVLGIYEDTGINQNQFGWLGSAFYIGYFAFQIMNSYLMPILPASKYLGILVCAWGTITACMSLGRTFQALFAFRVFLGFAEASTYPVSYHLVSLFYRRREQVIRLGILQCSVSVCSALGGLIGYGFGHMDGLAGLRAWRWCMLLSGAFTVLWGILIFVFLPDTVESRWFKLSPEEKRIVEDRSRDNAVVLRYRIQWSQATESVRDPRLYAYLFGSCFNNLITGALSVFRSQIIVQMGFSKLNSLLLNIPQGAAIICMNLSAIFLSFHFNEIGIFGALSAFVSFVGSLLLLVLPQSGVRLAGLYLAENLATNILMQTYIASNVSGVTKKTLYTSANLIGYTIGQFLGPLTLRQEDAPRYRPAIIAYMIAAVVTMAVFLYLRWSYKKENKQRHGILAGHSQQYITNTGRRQEDITDKEDTYFFYRI